MAKLSLTLDTEEKSIHIDTTKSDVEENPAILTEFTALASKLLISLYTLASKNASIEEQYRLVALKNNLTGYLFSILDREGI